MTLVTCHPRWGSSERLVIGTQLVEERDPAAGPPRRSLASARCLRAHRCPRATGSPRPGCARPTATAAARSVAHDGRLAARPAAERVDVESDARDGRFVHDDLPRCARTTRTRRTRSSGSTATCPTRSTCRARSGGPPRRTARRGRQAGLPVVDPARASTSAERRRAAARRAGAAGALPAAPARPDHVGLLVLATQRRWRAPYQSLFQSGAVRKTYRALAPARRPGAADGRAQPHREAPGRGGRPRSCRGAGQRRDARSSSSRPTGPWGYRPTPRTGRTHQLRVHLAGPGHPDRRRPVVPRGARRRGRRLRAARCSCWPASSRSPTRSTGPRDGSRARGDCRWSPSDESARWPRSARRGRYLADGARGACGPDRRPRRPRRY